MAGFAARAALELSGMDEAARALTAMFKQIIANNKAGGRRKLKRES